LPYIHHLKQARPAAGRGTPLMNMFD
jgi:hypothetical protein